MSGEKEPLITEDQKLAFLKEEAQKLEKEIGLQAIHHINMVLHVSSIALQFGQLGEIWNGFVPEEVKRKMEIPYAEKDRLLYLYLGDGLGKDFFKELQENITGIRGNIIDSFSADSLKRIAVISNTIGLWTRQIEWMKEKGLMKALEDKR